MKAQSTAKSLGIACLLSLMAGGTLLLAGCVENRYQAPVGSFYNATQQTTSVLGDYYSSRNEAEIDVYLSSIATDPNSPEVLLKSHGKPTPLGAPVYSPASIQARLDALTLVATYAHRLNDLANSTAPSDFQTAANNLGTNLSNLSTTFQKLADSGSDVPGTASNYVKPVTTLIGVIGQMYLNQRRDEMIKAAVSEGAPVVDTVLSNVKDDMDKLSLLSSTGASEKLAELVVAYDIDLKKPGGLSYEQKTARLGEIKAAALAVNAGIGSAPSTLVTNMQHAHEALVKTANASSKDKSLTLAALNSALQQWTGEIQTLANAVKLLTK